MSKFNNRVLWDFPIIQPLENFKDYILTTLTTYQLVIIRILKVLQEQFETTPNFRNIVMGTVLFLTFFSFLRYFGRKKHAFYRKERMDATQINKCTKSVKVEMDAMRKHILNFLQTEEANVVGEVAMKKQHQEKEDDNEVNKKFEKLKSVLELYEDCIQSNNKFNHYFLEEFVKVFRQINELKKSKGVRGLSKRKDVENKVTVPVQKKTQLKAPVKNGPVIPKPKSANNRKSEPLKAAKSSAVEPVQQKSKQEVATNKEVNDIQDHELLEFNDIIAEPPALPSIEQPQSDSLFQPQLQIQPNLPLIKQTNIQPETQPSSTTTQTNQQQLPPAQQIPDDPLISMQTVPTVKHSLPTLPIKPRKDVPPIGGRRPPPPPRR